MLLLTSVLSFQTYSVYFHSNIKVTNMSLLTWCYSCNCTLLSHNALLQSLFQRKPKSLISFFSQLHFLELYKQTNRVKPWPFSGNLNYLTVETEMHSHVVCHLKKVYRVKVSQFCGPSPFSLYFKLSPIKDLLNLMLKSEVPREKLNWDFTTHYCTNSLHPSKY